MPTSIITSISNAISLIARPTRNTAQPPWLSGNRSRARPCPPEPNCIVWRTVRVRLTAPLRPSMLPKRPPQGFSERLKGILQGRPISATMRSTWSHLGFPVSATRTCPGDSCAMWRSSTPSIGISGYSARRDDFQRRALQPRDQWGAATQTSGSKHQMEQRYRCACSLRKMHSSRGDLRIASRRVPPDAHQQFRQSLGRRKEG